MAPYDHVRSVWTTDGLHAEIARTYLKPDGRGGYVVTFAGYKPRLIDHALQTYGIILNEAGHLMPRIRHDRFYYEYFQELANPHLSWDAAKNIIDKIARIEQEIREERGWRDELGGTA